VNRDTIDAYHFCPCDVVSANIKLCKLEPIGITIHNDILLFAYTFTVRNFITTSNSCDLDAHNFVTIYCATLTSIFCGFDTAANPHATATRCARITIRHSESQKLYAKCVRRLHARSSKQFSFKSSFLDIYILYIYIYTCDEYRAVQRP